MSTSQSTNIDANPSNGHRPEREIREDLAQLEGPVPAFRDVLKIVEDLFGSGSITDGTEASISAMCSLLLDGTEGTDGTSNTIMIVEADVDHAVIWTKPDDLKIDPKKPLRGLKGTTHDGGFFTALGDGSVRFISNKIDLKTLNTLFTRNDGYAVGKF